MLPSRRSALLFFGKFALLFGLLMVPWPRVGQVFSIGFSIVATGAVETFIDDRDITVRFAPIANPKPGIEEWKVDFSASNARTGASTKTGIEARELAYVPFVTFLALAFATPLAPRRRRMILLGGFALLGLRLAIAIAVPIAHLFGEISSGSAADAVTRVVFWALIEPPDMMYAAPVVTFLLGLFVTSPDEGGEASARITARISGWRSSAS